MISRRDAERWCSAVRKHADAIPFSAMWDMARALGLTVHVEVRAAQGMPGASVSAWQPIETAPKDGSRFLATFFNDHVRENGVPQVDVLYWFPQNDPDGFWETVNYEPLDEWTHWMPLPKPPCDSDGSGEAG